MIHPLPSPSEAIFDFKCLWCCEHVKCILVFSKNFLLLLSLLAKEFMFDAENVLVVFKV